MASLPAEKNDTSRPSDHAAERVHNSGNEDTEPPRSSPGILAQLPIIPLAMFILALGLTAAIGTVVVLADTSRVSSWAVSPTVIVAAMLLPLNAIGAYLLAEGATISWWSRALHHPTTIYDLHWRWAAAQGLWGALTSLFSRGPSLAAVAYFAVLIATTNGPFSQRAIEVESATFTHNLQLDDLRAVAKLPRDFSAAVSDRSQALSVFTPDFSQVMKDYVGQRPINLDQRKTTNSTFTARLQAPGYSVDCRESNIDLPDFEEVGTDRYTDNYTELFISSIYYEEWPRKSIQPTVRPFRPQGFRSAGPGDRFFAYDSLWKPDSGCITYTNSTTLMRRECDITPAVVQYPVIINNSTLRLDPFSSYKDDSIISVETPEQRENDTAGAGSTHGGIALLLDARFAANYSLRADSSMLDVQLWEREITGLFSYEMVTESSSCDVKFDDPGPFVLAALRELAFRSAILASSGKPDASLGPAALAVQTEVVPVYSSDYKWLAGALAVSVLGLFGVLPSYAGFSKVGRRGPSMSPVEVANTFGFNAFGVLPGNIGALDVLKSAGSQQLTFVRSTGRSEIANASHEDT